MSEKKGTESSIVFSLNGEKVELKDVDPLMTLNQYIRNHTSFKGVKLSCGEGGCGACVVALSRFVDGKEETFSTNSCLRPLATMDGLAVVTTEGLRGKDGAYHPIHERIAGFNGSQCGFCTPGMVMTIYTSLKRGGKNVKMADIERNFDGNICRCTGYRPIYDAAKSFASDTNVKDHVGAAPGVGGYDHEKHDPQTPGWLKDYDYTRDLYFEKDGVAWSRPGSLKSLLGVLSKAGKGTELVVGGTGKGIYKDQSGIKHYVDVASVAELNGIKLTTSGLKVGANSSLTALEEVLRSNASASSSFTPLADHVYRIANFHIRNTGTVAGNLILARTKGFLSDLATILLGAQATVSVVSAKTGKSSDLSMEQFLENPKWDPTDVITTVTIPCTAPDVVFNTYKAAVRGTNAHAYVNAAFSARVEEGKCGPKFHDVVLAYGGVLPDDVPGSHAILAKKTAKVLVDADDILQSTALQTVKEEIADGISSGAAHAAYRKHLVVSFLKKFITQLEPHKTPKDERSAATKLIDTRPVSSAEQLHKCGKEHVPVSLPEPKLSAKRQAAGEAVYTGDISTLSITGHAAWVTSTIANGSIVSVDASAALKAPGVIAYINGKDVKGANCSSPTGEPVPVFADNGVSKDGSFGKISYWGQGIGLIVAETLAQAERASALVRVEYKAEKPLLTVQDGIDANKFVEGKVFTHKKGDFDKVLKEAKDNRVVRGKVQMGGQQHFYMEPQSVYVVPDEDGHLKVNVATQYPAACTGAVAGATNKMVSQVNVVNRRLGGGFGGKLTHPTLQASACASAAVALDRPVRLVLNRNVDMAMCGGREETDAEYEAIFDADGKITGLKITGVLAAGSAVDLSWFAAWAMSNAYNEAYDIPNLFLENKLVYTNTAPRTATRGPGENTASYVMETVIEHVASALGKDAVALRELNFYDPKAEGLKTPNGGILGDFTVPKMWEQVKAKAKYDETAKAVAKFNAENKYKKRGVSITPVRYEVGIWAKSALVNIYADGSVRVHHSAQEMGQGVHTKVTQVVAHELSKLFGDKIDSGEKKGEESKGEDQERRANHGNPDFSGDAVVAKELFDRIKCADFESSVLPNATFTGGSTGSEGSCAAAAMACAQLVERVRPIKETMKELGETVNWKTVIAKANGANVHLSATGHWSSTGATSLTYNNFGVCQSVVEIDVLTGEVQVLSSDIIYDCGKSLNPAIDIGQAEGAFVMGLGFFLSEWVGYTKDGALITDGTWEYKPPLLKDIPQRFTVEFLQDSAHKKGILSSKASGEPPLVLATSIATALRGAIQAARGKGFPSLPSPLTPDRIALACIPGSE